MLWQSLDRFKIELHMKYPTIPPPRERDQVIMEIVLKRVYSMAEIQSINQCRGMLQCIFLSDVVTADGRYLESFVFDPGPFRSWSKYCFPRECPSQQDWGKWFEFWHSYALTGDKLEIPLGIWINPTHRKWLWYTTPTDNLYRIKGRGCLPLFTIAKHMQNALNYGVHPSLEREDPQGSCNGRSGIGSGS
jgi:hypothetical protein